LFRLAITDNDGLLGLVVDELEFFGGAAELELALTLILAKQIEDALFVEIVELAVVESEITRE